MVKKASVSKAHVLTVPPFPLLGQCCGLGQTVLSSWATVRCSFLLTLVVLQACDGGRVSFAGPDSQPLGGQRGGSLQ